MAPGSLLNPLSNKFERSRRSVHRVVNEASFMVLPALAAGPHHSNIVVSLRRQHPHAVVPGRLVSRPAKIRHIGHDTEAGSAAQDVGLAGDLRPGAIRVAAIGCAAGELQHIRA